MSKIIFPCLLAYLVAACGGRVTHQVSLDESLDAGDAPVDASAVKSCDSDFWSAPTNECGTFTVGPEWTPLGGEVPGYLTMMNEDGRLTIHPPIADAPQLWKTGRFTVPISLQRGPGDGPYQFANGMADIEVTEASDFDHPFKAFIHETTFTGDVCVVLAEGEMLGLTR